MRLRALALFVYCDAHFAINVGSFNEAAKQRMYLSPRRRFASLGLR